MPALAIKDERPVSYGQKTMLQAGASTAFFGLDPRRQLLKFQVELHRQLGLLDVQCVWLIGAKNGDENAATVAGYGSFKIQERER